MRDRAEKILRLIVFALAALVLAQLIRAGFRANPLAGATIPPVPTLETNSVPGTNSVAAQKGSNIPPAKIQATNAAKVTAVESNAPPEKAVKAVPTNAVARAETNLPAVKVSVADSTNAVSASTNSIAAGTNAVAAPKGTNGLPAVDTNSIAAANPQKTPRKSTSPEMARGGGMGFGGFPGMPGPAAKLPAGIQARVDKIVDSEILAPVMRPLPMALLGIAGETAFLRSASGQTGLAKVGDSVGEIKLLGIGINRVLVEQDGQKKELMIFNGYGGESLLSTTNEISK